MCCWGGALLLAKSLVAPDKVGSAGSVIRAIALNGLLLPDPFYVSPSPKWDGALFPVDPPLWSLFFEVFVNLFWVGFLVARSRWLVLCLLVSVVALATGCYLIGSGNIGWDLASFAWGFPRVFAGFFLGVVLFKLKAYFPKSVNVSIGWMVLVLLGCFGLPPSVWKDLLCVLVVFPLVIVCAARMNGFAPRWDLGVISFAIYAVHKPVILWISAVQQYVAPKLSSGPLFASMLLLPICAAYVLNRYWDVPIQRWLKQR